MRICSTYGAPVPLMKGSDMDEIRLDVFGRVPDGCTENTVVTLAGKDISVVPKGFPGLVDVGDSATHSDFRTIRSIHMFEHTPDHARIVHMLSEGDQEISKGAFMASSFSDLHSIYLASKAVGRKHVILGMGEIGKVTRIRQNVLGNEFTFGFVGKPTAPGQLSSDELRSLGDDCEIVGIAGNPVSHSRSPEMQNAAMKAAGINGIYLRFESASIDFMRDVMAEYHIRGMNVTIPHKQNVIGHMDNISKTVRAVGAMNTVVNSDGWFVGENTDVEGILRTFEGQDIDGKKVLIMGSGGAARAAGFAFTESGCDTYVIGRNQETVDSVCRDLGTEHAPSTDVSDYDIIVNCTPIGMYSKGKYPADITGIHGEQTVFDMVYGSETVLLAFARAAGCRMMDGKDMLIAQGAASFEHWFGKTPDTKVMRGALR